MIDTVKVAPSILSADFVNMQRDIENLYEWGADMVHCDVMDGVFVKNLTFGMPMIRAIKKVSKLPLDVHLMIIEPERYIDEFIRAGADFLTFHPESSREPKATLIKIREKGAKAGLVFNPDIDYENYLDLLPLCDIIVIMGVYAGFGGQKYIYDVNYKLQNLTDYLNKKRLTTLVEVDGGVTVENAKEITDCGANVLVGGSCVFNANKPKEVISYLKSL